MGMGESSDRCWRGSHHAAVYAVLTALLDSATGQPIPGTEGVIGRAQAYFLSIGDRPALQRLDAVSVILFGFLQARRAGDEACMTEARARLDAYARDWLLDAPMFPGSPASYALAA